MNAPAWLSEFYRQWFEARGLKLEPSTRPFSRRWEELLDEAGLAAAADRSNAEAEARELQRKGHFALRFHKYRTYLIEAISLPPSKEPWLIALFGGIPAGELRLQSLAIVAEAQAEGHVRWPESWLTLCGRLTIAFEAGKNVAPFHWKAPGSVKELLRVLHDLTAAGWANRTLIREASQRLGFDSKFLEEKQGVIESALSLLFDEETSLESLGIVGSESHATVNGRLELRFADGTRQRYENLQGRFTISLHDLQRAVEAATPAQRIFSIENAKTTFAQAMGGNSNGETLLLATSFPNAATRRLLEILPADLPHYHFGDTDPSGYAILRSLREIGRRNVEKFLMDWQDAESSRPLSEHDRQLLPSLIASPLLSDCQSSLQAIQAANRKGRFEQESHGAPTLKQWPFWKSADTPRASVS